MTSLSFTTISYLTYAKVRLIAVSKLKPLNDILALHPAPQTHLDFGENYLQELQQKAGLYNSMNEFKCTSFNLHP